MNFGIILATYAGLGWAVGQLGKRYGAVEEHEEMKSLKEGGSQDSKSQLVIDSCVSIVYMLGACSTGIMISMMDTSAAYKVVSNASWQQRIRVTMLLGSMEGVATLLSVVVIGFAGRHSMSTIAPVMMNSLSTIFAPLVLAVFYGEHLGYGFYIAMTCLVLGIILASGASRKESDKSAEVGPGIVIAMGSFFVAGLWSCGTLGARYIMTGVPADLKMSWSSVSYACSVMPMVLSPIITIIANIHPGEEASIVKIKETASRRCKFAIFCGMLSGTGGLAFAVALAESGASKATLVGFSQGIYNVSCVFLFKIIYKEELTWSQVLGILIMLAGIVALSAAQSD